MLPTLLLLVQAVAPAPAEPAPLDPVAAVRAHRERNAAAILRDLAALLELPNVSSDAAGIRRNAAAIRARLEARGVAVELLTLPDAPEAPPVVLGRLPAPGAERTLGIYVHYDGQPVQPERWTFGPWTPTLTDRALEDGGRAIPWPEDDAQLGPETRIYARGSGDDRAPIAALLAALDGLAGAGIARTSNLLLFFEGEEEVGSPHLARYLEAHRERLEVDAWLICDGPVHPGRRPQLVFGVRGITSLELTVYGAARPLHSGHYGNWAPNPAHALARLLATMKDDDGRVLVEGFYDDVEPLGAAERAALDALPDVDEALRDELALADTEGEGSLAERLLLPSLNVRGLAAAGVGPQAKNVVPATATASIDVRLVRGCDPARMLDRVEAHVRSQGYHVVAAEPDRATRRAHPRLARIERRGGYPAARTAMDHPLVERLVAAAGRAAGEDVVRLPSLGGSLPLYLFDELGDAPVVIVPIANHDDNQHAPDENLRLANLEYGIDLMAALLTIP